MSRIRMQVTIKNESDARVRLRTDRTSRSWTPGWQPSRTEWIEPGESTSWQAEGDLVGIPTSGVEARVWYDLFGAGGRHIGELYVFANSPLVESQYGNTFTVRAPEGYYATYVDANGQKTGDNRAHLEITLRKTHKRSVPRFVPSKHAFTFSNADWSEDLPVMTLGFIWNRLLDDIAGDLRPVLGIVPVDENWIPVTRAKQGLCGGMCYAVMDYWNVGQTPPVRLNAAGVSVSPDSREDPLFLFVRERLMDSFDIGGRGHRWLSYSSPYYPDDDEGPLQTAGLAKGKAWVSYREEWPQIRALLDQGKPVCVGLVQTASLDIGENHQVLAYAYEQSAQRVKLWIYDPNKPGNDDARLEFDISDTSHGISVQRWSGEQLEDKASKIYAFFICGRYAPKVPPEGEAINHRPDTATLELIRQEAITTSGVDIVESKNSCGEPLRRGRWTCKTLATYGVRITGYSKPKVEWKFGDTVLQPGTTVPIEMMWDGTPRLMDVRLQPDARTMTVETQPGVDVEALVTVTVSQPNRETKVDRKTFVASGTHNGIKFEDIRAQARCIARSIPVEVQKIPAPHEGELDLQAWKERQIQVILQDPTIQGHAQQQLVNYIEQQAQSLDIREAAQKIALKRPGF